MRVVFLALFVLGIATIWVYGAGAQTTGPSWTGLMPHAAPTPYDIRARQNEDCWNAVMKALRQAPPSQASAVYSTLAARCEASAGPLNPGISDEP
jgi:hypothetical protein